MPESLRWTALAGQLAKLETRIRRESAPGGGDGAPRRDAVRRLYVRTVLLGDALQNAVTPADAPAAATAQRLVHRIVDSLDEDETPWLELTIVRRITRGARVVGTHAANVAVLSIATARALGLSRAEQADVGLAALAHDVRLSNEAGAAVDCGECHDIEGAAWLLTWAPVDTGIRLAAVAAGHRAGGATDTASTPGAPHALDLTTRIVRIADAFDVLSGRDGAAGSPDLVLAFLLQGTADRFDTALLKLFARVIGVYPPGTGVRLSDGTIAVVVRPNRRREGLDRPAVRIVRHASGEEAADPAVVDLASTGGRIVATVELSAHGIDPAALALGR